jgi:hypothetical protein
MDALEHVGRRDIGEVEWGVLAQQHHVEFREFGAPRLTQGEMVARDVSHAERLDLGENPSIEQSEPVRRVISQLVAAFLGFQEQGECRVAFDVDPLDRIHLNGDFQAHDYL